MSQAHFTNRRSRAESLFTTFSFHTHTTYFSLRFSCCKQHALKHSLRHCHPRSVPSLEVCPPPHGHRVPGHAGGLTKGRWASGNGSPDLQTKQTMSIYKFYDYYSHTHSTHTSTHNLELPFTGLAWSAGPTLLWCYCIYGGFFDWFHWQFPHNCLYECEIKRKTLLAKNSLFPRSVRTTSLEENGGK